MRSKVLAFFGIFNLILPQAIAIELPDFLPAYYAPVLEKNGRPLALQEQSTEAGVEMARYITSDATKGMVIENIQCERPRCKTFYNNAAAFVNDAIGKHSGEFIEVTTTEFRAGLLEGGVHKQFQVFLLPESVQLWTLSSVDFDEAFFSSRYQRVQTSVNQQRYVQSRGDNIDQGLWGPSIYKHAEYLLESGDIQSGLDVLRRHLSTSPQDYNAHITLMSHAKGSPDAKTSAQIVYKHAESRGLIDQAAEYLGKPNPADRAYPSLEPAETGLELIVIPLPPYNPWLLDEAISQYEEITGVPTKVRKLDEEWNWSLPERVAGQRYMQDLLLQLAEEPMDFSGWTGTRYAEALRNSVAEKDALTQFQVEQLIAKLDQQPGQFDVTAYLARFSESLSTIRSPDNRTMYVGFTEANIYSGDNNYLFSLGYTAGDSRASILSYHMMLGETLGAAYQSRKRLTERIAKEMVPASLKQLNIPRSIDPSCPYSYSGGVDRLDQKSLVLSDPVKTALKELASSR